MSLCLKLRERLWSHCDLHGTQGTHAHHIKMCPSRHPVTLDQTGNTDLHRMSATLPSLNHRPETKNGRGQKCGAPKLQHFHPTPRNQHQPTEGKVRIPHPTKSVDIYERWAWENTRQQKHPSNPSNPVNSSSPAINQIRLGLQGSETTSLQCSNQTAKGIYGIEYDWTQNKAMKVSDNHQKSIHFSSTPQVPGRTAAQRSK